MNRPDVVQPVKRSEAVIGEVIDRSGGAADGRAEPYAAPPSRAESALRSLHGLLLGITTIALAAPTVIAVITVTVLPIAAWFLVATALRVAFRAIAWLAGLRPGAVMPGAFLRVQGMRGFARPWQPPR